MDLKKSCDFPVLHTPYSVETLCILLAKDPSRIVYIVNEKEQVTGIFTQGDFCRQTDLLHPVPNKDFFALYEESASASIAVAHFQQNPNICRIPVLNVSGCLLYEFVRVTAMKEAPQPIPIIQNSPRFIEEYLSETGYQKWMVLAFTFSKERWISVLNTHGFSWNVVALDAAENFFEWMYGDISHDTLIIFDNDATFHFLKTKKCDVPAVTWQTLLVDAQNFQNKQQKELYQILTAPTNVLSDFFPANNMYCFCRCTQLETQAALRFQKEYGNNVQILPELPPEILETALSNTKENLHFIFGSKHQYQYPPLPLVFSFGRFLSHKVQLMTFDWNVLYRTAEDFEKRGIFFYLVDMSDLFSSSKRLPAENERRFSTENLWHKTIKPGKQFLSLLGNDYWKMMRESIDGQVITAGFPTRLQDYIGTYFNIINGHRVTSAQPECPKHTIYLFGACFVFGFFSKDDESVPSILQRMLSERGGDYSKCKIINCSRNAYYLPQMVADLQCIPFQPGDCVVMIETDFYKHVQSDGKAVLRLPAAQLPQEREEIFFDTPLHFNHRGNRILAQMLMDYLPWETIFLQQPSPSITKDMPLVHGLSSDEQEPTDPLSCYLRSLQHLRLATLHMNKIGAVVMNCNPFTNGHLHLIEYASQHCDWLYLFVVEEDRSIFSFQERISLIRQGTLAFKNITILPSGKFIISTLTFPDYFTKESNGEITIDTTRDLTVFGQHIAATLNISVRFVGEEPSDKITRQYNESMKQILPKYGVSLVEIPRKTVNESPISASTVRRLIREGNLDKLKQIVPLHTFQFIVENQEILMKRMNCLF